MNFCGYLQEFYSGGELGGGKLAVGQNRYHSTHRVTVWLSAVRHYSLQPFLVFVKLFQVTLTVDCCR